ncbi:MAG TPA: class II glutamine amidotransferase [Rhodocyclaceae bacterium]|nr:class II glutamine amidotransferase [Zoogloeaceae bacterium]HRD33335.1 class II glutamine amidotransferase [Rhodocyclaceae bacterium]
MCQLLGMNANKPASIKFSFEGFVLRGGRTDEHRDGWGLAFFEGHACRTLHDCRPSADSPLVEHLHRHPVKSRNIIAHIRKATQGGLSLQNCHPFTRELWGQHWAFAHNGNLKNFDLRLSGRYLPVGETDSEHAFCYLLQELGHRFGALAPTTPELFEALVELSARVAAFGPFNFLLSNGSGLFAYCTTELHFVTRCYPFASVRVLDHDLQVDFGRYNHLDDCMSVIATKPLTSGEDWTAFAPGELRYFFDGAPTRKGVLRRQLAVSV